MRKFIEKLFGVDKIKEEITTSLKEAAQAKEAAEKAREEERLSKLTPKELATERKEPWVTVLQTHVNKDNLRNGFFELDWNEYFVVQLKQAGYKGSTDEELVDSWFSDLCRNLGQDASINMDQRGSGLVQRALRDDGKTEVS
jgi:hypothetical protein